MKPVTEQHDRDLARELHTILARGNDAPSERIGPAAIVALLEQQTPAPKAAPPPVWSRRLRTAATMAAGVAVVLLVTLFAPRMLPPTQDGESLMNSGATQPTDACKDLAAQGHSTQAAVGGTHTVSDQLDEPGAATEAIDDPASEGDNQAGAAHATAGGQSSQKGNDQKGPPRGGTAANSVNTVTKPAAVGKPGSLPPDTDQREAIAGYLKAGALLVDVRDKAAYERGHLAEAVHIPLDQLTLRADGYDRDRMIVVYAATAADSASAAGTLRRLGYSQVIDLGPYDRLR